jgi:hypothetical protein
MIAIGISFEAVVVEAHDVAPSALCETASGMLHEALTGFGLGSPGKHVPTREGPRERQVS